MGRTVLFVDDDADLREVMSIALGQMGHACVAVSSFQELLGLGERAFDCDLAILDINLGPVVPSGIDAFKHLRARRFNGAVVFLTGHGLGHPGVAEAERLGLARVLQKPLSFEELDALIANVAPANASHRA
jgi:DNA-binding NtrC family response regulator